MNTTTLSKSLFVALSLTIGLSYTSQAQADLDPALCALGGGVAGGVIGGQFGGGDGKKALAIIGAIAGAVGGHGLCKSAQDQQDIDYARQNEQRVLQQGQPTTWSNPRYGRDTNSRSHIEKRGWYGDRECTMTRSVMQDRGGSYVNETVWCNQNGQWVRVSETTTIRQIQWGARGPVAGPSRPMPPREERYPSRILSDNRVSGFASDVKRAFDSDRKGVVRNYVRDFQRDGKYLTLNQLGDVLRAATFDSTREDILPVLVGVVDQNYGSTEAALSAFNSSHSKDRARSILSRADRRDDRGHDDRRDDRDDRRREGVPHRRR